LDLMKRTEHLSNMFLKINTLRYWYIRKNR
jgi:hypothetical protein